ncbi:unnamed protein product [Knipowitschia caucasica]
MSSDVLKHRHTSAMEKIIKNAVSESSKVLEKMIVELRAEILQVKSENENLKIRCSQFEAVVKKGSVYRETGTSPEPYIIDKCDKAVQCEITLHQPEDNPIISDNESERSSMPAYEKESSNDSFEFIQIIDDEQSLCDSLDETIKETSLNQETNTNDDRPEHENMANKEKSSCPSKEEIVTTILSSESELIEESSCKTYEMETPETVIEDADNECAETDASLLKFQKEAQKELKKVSIDQQEDINYPLDNDVIICETYDQIVSFARPEDMNVSTENEAICKKSQLVEGESSPLPDLSNKNVLEHDAQETTEMDVEIVTQSELSSSELKSGRAYPVDAKITSPEDHVDEVVSTEENASMDTEMAQEQSCTPAIQPMPFESLEGRKNTQNISFNQKTHTNDDRPGHENTENQEMSCLSSKILTTSLEMASMDTHTAQEQGCTQIDSSTIQPMSPKGLKGKKTTKKQQTMNYPYYLRRQRCTSVTQEDAMLLLDSVNLPEFKISRRAKTRSLCFETPKVSKTPRKTKASKERSIPLKGNASTTEKLQPQQTEDVQEESCINSVVMEDQLNDQEPSITKPSPVIEEQPNDPEPSITKPSLVIDIIDLTLDDDETSDDMETSLLSNSVTNDTTPYITPRQESETSPSADCMMANIDTEDNFTNDTTQNITPSEESETSPSADCMMANIDTEDNFTNDTTQNITPSEESETSPSADCVTANIDTEDHVTNDTIINITPSEESETSPSCVTANVDTEDHVTNDTIINITPSEESETSPSADCVTANIDTEDHVTNDTIINITPSEESETSPSCVTANVDTDDHVTNDTIINITPSEESEMSPSCVTANVDTEDHVTNDTTPAITPRKESETSPSAGCLTANIDTEDQEMTTPSTKPIENVTQQTKKTTESISVAAVLSALASSLAQKANGKKLRLSTADQDQEKQATENTQKDTFSLIPHIAVPQPQSNSGEMAENAQIDCHGTRDVGKVTSPIMSPPQPQAGSRETRCNAQIDGPVTCDSECQSKAFPVPSTGKPALNPVVQGNLPVPKPGDTGNGCNLISSQQSLSAAQISAVVSAVRSSDGTGPASSGKKTIVVVPLPPVKKPNHTIIVIPRQGNPSDHPPQTIVEDVDTGELVQQQSSAVGNTSEPSHTLPSPENAQCRSTVQVKLNRLMLPILPTQTVSVTNKSPSGSPAKQKHDSSGSASKISQTATTQPEAQPVKDVTRPVTDTTSVIRDKRKTSSQESPKERVDSSDKPIQILQLYPSVAADHSYPQLTMTKSQFLAQLHVSPVIQDGSGEKGVQKCSLVDRLRSHIKTHTKSTQKVKVASKPQVDCLSNANKTAGQNQEQTAHLQGISQETLPDTVAPVESNKSDDPKIQQVGRKRGTTTDETVTKTVKKRKCVVTRENTILQSNLRNKLINSNALLSCVRKGLSKNSFLCKFCQKEFPKKSEIEKHIQVHAGKKPFQCNLCRKRFCKTRELSKHLKKHDAEKKYDAEKKFQCTFCGKAFMENNNLRRHLYIHTGEKPFGCPYCPRTFIQPGYLNLHVDKDHKDAVST